MLSVICFNLDQFKILSSGEELTLYQTKKNSDWSKLKAFADDKIDVTKTLKFGLGRVENIVGKGENDGYLHFFLFPQYFQKAFYTGSLKVLIVWQRVNSNTSLYSSNKETLHQVYSYGGIFLPRDTR